LKYYPANQEQPFDIQSSGKNCGKAVSVFATFSP